MKQRKALDEDSLMLIPRPLTFKGANKNWYHDMAKHDDWTKFDISNFIINEKQMPMKNIVCPVCLESNTIGRLKLSVRAAFSNLKCSACNNTNSTRKWGCECGCLWYKCHIHYRPNSISATHTPMHRKRKCPEKGYDLPLPKFRKPNQLDMQVECAVADRWVWYPPPGSSLANRFPHLVKGAAPT